MRIKFLILIAVSIFVTLVTFVVFVYLVNLESHASQEYVGGGAIETDSGLSPSYAYDYRGGFFQFHMITVAGPIMLGIISLVFLVPNIILRIKKIPPRKYMLVIAAIVLIFFGISSIQNGLSVLTPEHFERQSDYRINLIGALIPIGIGSIPFALGIVMLKKAKLRIRK